MSPEPQKEKDCKSRQSRKTASLSINRSCAISRRAAAMAPKPTLIEGDLKLVTKKWQGYPPDKCKLIGKPHPAMPEVMLPRLDRQGDVRHARGTSRTCCVARSWAARILAPW